MKQNKVLILAISASIILSCSHVNRDSKEIYDRAHSFSYENIPSSNETQDIRLESLDLKSIARGKKTYNKQCIRCHGQSGSGDGVDSKQFKVKPRDISRLAKEAPNFKFIMKLSKWKGNMPGWKDRLTDKEIEDLENYIVYLSNESI